MTKLNEKPLSQMLEEIEPNVNTGVHGSFMTDTSITQTILPMVDRASYDKLKQVAIGLAKHCESLKGYASMVNYPDNEIAHALLVEIPFYADGVINSAKDIIGGGNG